ncbi:MAG: glucose-6-phosphate isomerase [Alphaproteobacteria bacterium]|jgi:glucose-6-phosphate isomerase|nr:glucose-6-phosphate isomerase [Alphaproteobacteria bacterium]
MPYRQLIETCFSDAIGEGGLDRAAFETTLAEAARALDGLCRNRDAGSLPLLALPARTDDLAAIAQIAERFRKSFDDVLVLGTGGSSLGGRTLAALGSDGPDLHFIENVDPDGFEVVLAGADPARTGVIAISKSGSTLETMAQALVVLDWLEGKPADRMVAIGDPGDSPLRRLAATHEVPVIDHDPGIGGRYSALSVVGGLPAAIAGVDVALLRQGAAEALEAALGAAVPADSPPAVGAALSIALARHAGATITVLMPYIDRLADFALWHRQLWAESLGKSGEGTTPVPAMGAVDQHSQLQLYLDGPGDKMFTLMTGPSAGAGRRIDPTLAGDPELAYLGGHALGDLLDAMAEATAETLARNGRPVRRITLDAVDERSLGAVMMHFMLETILAADLLGVNPFDQPAVDEGKALARARLGAKSGAKPGSNAESEDAA